MTPTDGLTDDFCHHPVGLDRECGNAMPCRLHAPSQPSPAPAPPPELRLDPFTDAERDELIHEGDSEDVVAPPAPSESRLREALEKLVAKLDAMEKPVNGCIAVSAMHGCPYLGPNWKDEMEAAKSALRPASPVPESSCEDPGTLENIKGHWFIQGGEAQFGSIRKASNPDEIIAAILRLVRAQPLPQTPPTCQTVTRFEVIDWRLGGRCYSRTPCSVELSYQDDGRTLKVFVYEPAPSTTERP